jgi:hypothetical protein|tara:strand:- start:96 stop:944 length:849 start_codon:yes stop_codon:yes gene_type:complete
MTDTALVKLEDPDYIKRIKAMSGQLVTGSDNFIPGIRINKNPETEDKKHDLPVGVFTLRSKQHDGVDVYSKRRGTVTFRPFVHKMRYEAYDSLQNKTVGRSIYFTSFSEEIIADNGVLKAGHKSEAIAETTKAKCKHIVFGLLSFKGTTEDGTEVEVVDEPSFVKAGGKAFIEISDMFKEFDNSDRILPMHYLSIEPTNHGEGIYSTALAFEPLTKTHVWDTDTEEALIMFDAYITAENDMIQKKWEAKVLKNSSDSADYLVGGNLEDDLADATDTDFEEVA